MKKTFLKDLIIILLLLSGTAFLYFGFLKKPPKTTKPPYKKIGVVLPFSGKNKDIGNLIATSSMTAAYEVNRFGGINNIPLKVEAGESWCIGAYARLEGAFYMQSQAIEWIITGLCPAETASLADLSYDNEVVMFTFHSLAELDNFSANSRFNSDGRRSIGPLEKKLILSLSDPEISISDQLSTYLQDIKKHEQIALLSNQSLFGAYWQKSFQNSLATKDLWGQSFVYDKSGIDIGALKESIIKNKIDAFLLITDEKEELLPRLKNIRREIDLPIYLFDSSLDLADINENLVINFAINKGIIRIPEEIEKKIIIDKNIDLLPFALKSYVVTNLISDFMQQKLYGEAVVQVLKETGIKVNNNYIQFDDEGNLIWEVIIQEKDNQEIINLSR